ncbi:Anthranilate phosphoribosyltransferase [Lachnellula cervina]|uniref:Anthranilate phosphoribosyltransferase n=1 Tax=Lachnellula cervina TaxID=1316786 RepID=A0A7D8YNB0_9HELO|nr:Anthranilate phosphoribosyltransferase [Lachnellula cervina]
MALSPTQCASPLTFLQTTPFGQNAEVIAKCAARMRDASSQVDCQLVQDVVNSRTLGKARGSYRGGMCTIEGMGGDGYSTFNVSTAAAILASAYVFIAKHGAGASSSSSGAADVLRAIGADSDGRHPRIAPVLESVTPESLPAFYKHGSFAFLFSPVFHPAHPLAPIMEARVVGVAEKQLGLIYAEALRLLGVKKALVVCGAEHLDETSCAGPTFCFRLAEDDHCTGDEDEGVFVRVEEFLLTPADFGLPVHSLSQTSTGKSPSENAAVLVRMMSGELSDDDPVLHFVLMNVTALFVVAGLCDDDTETSKIRSYHSKQVIQATGPGGGRWKEGLRRARLALESGFALKSLNQYIENTKTLGSLV